MTHDSIKTPLGPLESVFVFGCLVENQGLAEKVVVAGARFELATFGL